MSVNNVPTGSPTPAVYTSSGASGVGILDTMSAETMSPEDIMTYVQSALGSIGDQMNDYKTAVKKRQEKANELREAMALMGEMKNGEGKIEGSFPEEKYNRMMTLLAKNSGDDSANGAYKTFLNSYGGYHATEAFTLPKGTPVAQGELQGTMAGADENHDLYLRGPDGQPLVDPNTNDFMPNPDYAPGGKDGQDVCLSENETQRATDDLKRAMESLNSDNEMVMMELQKLMQQRNQITQFASNAMNLDNETKKGVIGNIR